MDSNVLTGFQEGSFFFYEPITMTSEHGDAITLQIWKVQSPTQNQKFNKTKTVSKTLQFSSYLPSKKGHPTFTETITEEVEDIGSKQFSHGLQGRSTLYYLNFYRNGSLIDPDSDEEFKYFSWVDGKPWINRSFSREELCRILIDIQTKWFSYENMCPVVIHRNRQNPKSPIKVEQYQDCPVAKPQKFFDISFLPPM
eukprot:TRINITY_DN627_c0_g1_i1.p1 TRINITY_DN627_c0_g1~~TRINITY_DN627_c0_g1_i1.p1  ORF type:complete len:229 (+),score=32.50 TRINITY_DN627_c0_g1_i1:99-689(+)